MPAGRPSKNGLSLVLSTLVLFFSFLVSASSIPRNITIDDQEGDRVTGEVPLYQPPSAWTNETCFQCAIKPDADRLFHRTAMTTTSMLNKHNNIPNTIDFNFTGTAIYIFFTLFSNEGPGVVVDTECNFAIDGENVGYFNHSGDPTKQPGTGREYGVLVFSKTGLLQTGHHMRISVAGVGRSVFLSFDSAVYTTDHDSARLYRTPPLTVNGALRYSRSIGTNRVLDSDSTSSNQPDNQSSAPPVPPGVIAGGVVGGVAVLSGFIALVYYYRRDSRRYRAPSSPGPTTPRPFIDPGPRSLPRPQGQPSSLRSDPVPERPSFSQTSSSGSGNHHGSVEHRIRTANQRMRSLRAEMASVSARTAQPSSQSNSSKTASSSSSSVMKELTEEVKKLRRELQALKELQRQQVQTQTMPPTGLEEPPPKYTVESNPQLQR